MRLTVSSPSSTIFQVHCLLIYHTHTIILILSTTSLAAPPALGPFLLGRYFALLDDVGAGLRIVHRVPVLLRVHVEVPILVGVENLVGSVTLALPLSTILLTGLLVALTGKMDLPDRLLGVFIHRARILDHRLTEAVPSRRRLQPALSFRLHSF